MAQSPEYPDLAWVPPRSFSAGRPFGPPRFITIHYTAGSEGPGAAEAGALYDQRRTDGTSAHYYVDSNSVVQCVRTTDRSHTAMQHGNRWGIHYELCGTVQTRAQWLDAVSRPTIRNAARQAARDMVRWGIPLVRKTTTQLRDPNARGICGHVDWTVGWPEDRGSHTDPGPQFPWDVLLADISEFLTGVSMGFMDDPNAAALAWRVQGLIAGLPKVIGGPTVGEVIMVNVNLAAVDKKLDAVASAVGQVDEAVASSLADEFASIKNEVDQVAQEAVEALAAGSTEDIAESLRVVLGPRAAEVGALLAAATED